MLERTRIQENACPKIQELIPRGSINTISLCVPLRQISISLALQELQKGTQKPKDCAWIRQKTVLLQQFRKNLVSLVESELFSIPNLSTTSSLNLVKEFQTSSAHIQQLQVSTIGMHTNTPGYQMLIMILTDNQCFIQCIILPSICTYVQIQGCIFLNTSLENHHWG